MIVGFTNPHNGKRVTLDGIADMERVMPAGIIKDLYEKEMSDTRHTGAKQTATSFSGCARRTFIDRALPTYPDPQQLWPMKAGTILHANFGLVMAREVDADGNKVWYTEEMDEDKCVHRASIWGIDYDLKLDLVKRDYTAIWDWKTSMNRADMWIKPNRDAKGEHTVQLNMARMGVEKSTGKDMRDCELAAWIVGGTWQKTYCKYLTEDAMGAVKVGGSPFRAKELFTAVHMAFSRWVDEAASCGGDLYKVPISVREQIAREIPLYGKQMWKNKRGGYACTDYCAVKRECDAIEGGI